AAVRADRDIDAGLFIVFIAGFGNLNDSGGLAAADALGFAGDADRTAADADLDKVGPGFGKEEEPVAIHDIARADLDAVAVMRADPIDRAALPFAEPFGGIDAEHVHPGFDQGGHTLGIVAGVDAGADDIALVFVQQFVDVFLVAVV